MPSLNFKAKFAHAIASGKKRQTIRPLGKRKYKRGEKVYLYTGQRTKNCRLLGTAIIVDVRNIEIKNDISPAIVRIQGVDGIPYQMDEITLDLYAKHDGFSSVADFLNFFKDLYGDVFRGQEITWRDFNPISGRSVFNSNTTH